MSGGSKIQPAPAPMNELDTETQSSTSISMIIDIYFPPIMPTEALASSKIGLPDTLVILMIYLAPDVEDDGDEIV